MLNPMTGVPLAHPSAGGEVFVRFHYTLLAGKIGIWLVAAAAMAMLLALISGIVIHKRIFRDLFTFRPRAALRA